MRRRDLLRGLGGAFGMAAAGAAGGAAPAPPEQVDLFHAGQEGYALYRIPGIVVTARGTVLAYCEARRTGKSDWDSIDLLLRRSTDGGRTWSPPRRVAEVPGPKRKNPLALAQRLANPDDLTYNNPVAIADRHPGRVHFLFCLEYERCFAVRSDDDGQSWSAPDEITGSFTAFRPEYPWKVLATGPGHGIQLRGGRLVVPVWLSTGTGGHAHRPSVVSVIYSDDGGAAWQRGDLAVPNTAEWVNPSESAIAELADGQVLLNVRSESPAHRRLATRSADGARGWSRPELQPDLLEPICMGSMLRLPGRPELVFANPATLEPRDPARLAAPGEPRTRKNLSLRVSRDHGRTWSAGRVLEPGFSGYSDQAALPDGTVLCFYERGSTDGKSGTRTGRLTLARCTPEWLGLG